MKFRKAKKSDLKAIIELLFEDELGSTREIVSDEIHPNYLRAFKMIQKDPNQALMVVEKHEEIIGTCHLTLLQLTTNKLRTRAKVFYERLGFRATHEGMKLHLLLEN